MDAQRLHDIELALLELARVVTGVVEVGAGIIEPQRKAMLNALDNVNALCSPDPDSDPDYDPPAAAALTPPGSARFTDCLAEGFIAYDNSDGSFSVYEIAGSRRIFRITVLDIFAQQDARREAQAA